MLVRATKIKKSARSFNFIYSGSLPPWDWGKPQF